MTDIVSQEKRSEMMSGIRGKNTKPEMIVRRFLHAKGYRFRLHDRRLPGAPDMIFPKFSAVIFVHGCFWHGHDCHLFKWPKTREKFWRDKLEANRVRDLKNKTQLMKSGWRVAEIWECALKGQSQPMIADVVDVIDKWLCSGDNYLELKS